MLTGRPIYPCSSLVELSVLLGRGEPPTRPRRFRPSLPARPGDDLPEMPRTRSLATLSVGRGPARRPAPLPRRPPHPGPADPGLGPPRPLGQAPAEPGRPGGLALTAAAVTAGLIIRHERQLETKNLELTRSNDQLRKPSISATPPTRS